LTRKRPERYKGGDMPMNGVVAGSVLLLVAILAYPVRKHLPWNDIVDRMPPQEEPIGAAGSSCNCPSVLIQAFPVVRLVRGQPSTAPGWQPISGIGDEAWFRANRTDYAEPYVKTATHTLTIQTNADGNVEAVKPGAISLAKALLAKL
jgi:hypothetical protein